MRKAAVWTVEALNRLNHHRGDTKSLEVDELIVEIMNLECSESVDEDDERCLAVNDKDKLRELWDRFIQTCEAQIPNISVFNLVSLEAFFLAARLYRKSLYVTLLTSRITPNSQEAFQRLAITYERLEDYGHAAAARERLSELQRPKKRRA